jgi:hypothetical protein
LIEQRERERERERGGVKQKNAFNRQPLLQLREERKEKDLQFKKQQKGRRRVKEMDFLCESERESATNKRRDLKQKR